MLEVRGLSKQFKGEREAVHAVADVCFQVGEAETVTLLGPSGCGKTTILRCVAGLERVEDGEIVLDGVLVSSRQRRVHVPTPSRPIAMVFQSYAVWPHMTVWENVAYPLRFGKERVPKHLVYERVAEALGMVRIPELAGRNATALSGGQQQRVALARALVRRPKLLLLDEPLSNLDAKLREETRLEMRELFDQAGTAVLYVTHDLTEALALSDRIVVIEKGRVVQMGTPEEVYTRPRNQLVAGFMGAGEIMEGRVAGLGDGRLQVDVGPGVLACPLPSASLNVGDPVLVAVRPEEMNLGGQDTETEGVTLPCVVERVVFLGPLVEYRVRTQGKTLAVRVTAKRPLLSTGVATTLHIPASRCLVFPANP